MCKDTSSESPRDLSFVFSRERERRWGALVSIDKASHKDGNVWAFTRVRSSRFLI